MKQRFPSIALLFSAMAALLGGCASLQPDAALAPVQTHSQLISGQPLRWIRSEQEQQAANAELQQRLGAPLDLAAAQAVALLAHHGLQAELHELGIADAERVQLARPPSPSLGVTRLSRATETEWELGLHLNLLAWFQGEQRERIGNARLAQAQQQLALRLLSLSSRVRVAWVEAVAAQQQLHYAEQVLHAAEASAELARRLREAGNFSALREAREQSFHAEAELGLLRAREQLQSRREALVRALGLSGPAAQNLTLPARLPDLPELPAALPSGADEQQALAQRIDLQAARRLVELRAAEAGLGRASRWVDMLDLGLQRNSSNEQPTQRGIGLDLTLPLFDNGEARLARAEHLHLQAVQRAAQQAVTARSELREAQSRLQSRHQMAKIHLQQLVPLRQRIAAENLLRYNGMLIGVFELLADARAQVAAVSASIAALRDFWIADAQLQQALLGPVDAIAETTATTDMSPAAEAGSPGH
ncbi:TolC family protein [Paucibacter sp. APW11]|uniref:TolC family protein n=1 Tax=Roseateles aquae TaxID=3077235 RepID=A0ABU3PI19_9BURK|nr:TolC family protein [Paucibacter sp. APW11]MDT9002214.1 TolC family protein [Paucibacter sp. APW11]